MIEVMEQTVSASGGIAELILQPTAENNQTMLALRDFLLSDIDPDVAMTDPSLYRKLSRLRTEMILRGWHHYFKGSR